MLTRRELLERSLQLGALAAVPGCLAGPEGVGSAVASEGVEVNDVQSQLNATRVRRVVVPRSLDDLAAAVATSRREGCALSVAGGRHAMGGQQFGRDTLLLDMRQLDRVLAFDQQAGLVEVEGGIAWPGLIDALQRAQIGASRPWAIREKQTGVDRVTLAGSLASNVHGRGLTHPPIIGDVESFVLVDATGRARTCSRRENSELFSLAIGGYGLFGVIAQVTLRLVPRTKVERVVEVIPVRDLLPAVDRRIADGFVQGDCQYSIDLEADEANHPGVFACYRPVADETPIPEGQKQLSAGDWAELYTLARTDKRRAFERYAEYYLTTSGQVYWSDTHQLAGSFDGYRTAVDKARGTEMITEVYVSRDAFLPFMIAARRDCVEHGADITYGTIRFIEADRESFLPWAREASVCIVCNLHVRHTEQGLALATAHFRRIIDRAIGFGGRYYLTYHRWATRQQVETCYPRFVDMLRLKREHDPQERFQSEWYRHYRAMFADQL